MCRLQHENMNSIAKYKTLGLLTFLKLWKKVSNHDPTQRQTSSLRQQKCFESKFVFQIQFLKMVDKLLKKLFVFKFHACLLPQFMSTILLNFLAVDDVVLIDEKDRVRAQEMKGDAFFLWVKVTCTLEKKTEHNIFKRRDRGINQSLGNSTRPGSVRCVAPPPPFYIFWTFPISFCNS